jgi:AmmeMemoRadiSam system protein B
MKKIRIWYVILTIFIIFLLYVLLNAFISIDNDENVGLKNNISQNEKVSISIDDEIAEKVINSDMIYDFEKNIKAAVIPHHALPYKIHADFYNRIGNDDYENILLIGPNHNDSGDYNVLVSDITYETNFGEITFNETMNENLLKNDFVNIGNKIITEDHSITYHLPYIAKFSDAKISTMLMKRTYDVSELDTIANGVNNSLKQNDLVIASVDFSHYLDSYSAQENDNHTKILIEDKNYNEIIKLNNDYIDSPESLIFVMKLAEMNDWKYEILENTNSGFIMNSPYSSTTSYLYIVFYE